MDPTYSISSVQQLAIGSYHWPDKSNLQLHIIYFKIKFNIILTSSPLQYSFVKYYSLIQSLSSTRPDHCILHH